MNCRARHILFLALVACAKSATKQEQEPPTETASIKAPLSVTLPPEGTALSPLSPLVVTFSEPVKTPEAVIATVGLERKVTSAWADPASRGPVSVQLASTWSEDRKTLTLRGNVPFPLAADLRLSISGAQSESDEGFPVAEQVLHVKRNPPLLRVSKPGTAMAVSEFYTLDANGHTQAILSVAGEPATPQDGTPLSCQVFTRNGPVEESLLFEEAGPNATFCDSDDTALQAYSYAEEGATVYRSGRSTAAGADGTFRTADDQQPFYLTLAASGPHVLTSCTSAAAGADGAFATEDDAKACTCLTEQVPPPEGLSSRIWITGASCDVSASLGYLDLHAPTAGAQGKQQELRQYDTAAPGVAAPATDHVTVRGTLVLDGEGLFTEVRYEGLTRYRRSYDALGNLLSQIDDLAGADGLWNTGDDVVTVRGTYDPTR